MNLLLLLDCFTGDRGRTSSQHFAMLGIVGRIDSEMKCCDYLCDLAKSACSAAAKEERKRRNRLVCNLHYKYWWARSVTGWMGEW